MEKIIEKSNRLIQKTSVAFQREIGQMIQWDWRLIFLIGARGVGKTTLLLQRLKLVYGVGQKAIYISLDDIYFTGF